jgi:hypothetical protein
VGFDPFRNASRRRLRSEGETEGSDRNTVFKTSRVVLSIFLFLGSFRLSHRWQLVKPLEKTCCLDQHNASFGVRLSQTNDLEIPGLAVLQNACPGQPGKRTSCAGFWKPEELAALEGIRAIGRWRGDGRGCKVAAALGVLSGAVSHLPVIFGHTRHLR